MTHLPAVTGTMPAAGVPERAAAAEGPDAPAGLGHRAEEERVLLQPGHGAGEGEGPGEREGRAHHTVMPAQTPGLTGRSPSPQALHSRDSLQLEYTDCLLDKNRLRKRIAELQANLEQQQREVERERERSQGQVEQSSPCLHCVSYHWGVLLYCNKPRPEYTVLIAIKL